MEKTIRRIFLAGAAIGAIAVGIGAALERHTSRVTANERYVAERVNECDRISHPGDREVCRTEVAARYAD
jgi:hypothetical protein